MSSPSIYLKNGSGSAGNGFPKDRDVSRELSIEKKWEDSDMCRTMPARRAWLMSAAVCSLLSPIPAAAQSVWNIDPTGTGHVELTGSDPAQSYDQVHIGRQFGEGVLVVRDGGQLLATDYIQLGNTGSPGAGLDGPGYGLLQRAHVLAAHRQARRHCRFQRARCRKKAGALSQPVVHRSS